MITSRLSDAEKVWMTVRGFNFRMGETHTDPFHPFDHPLVTWHHYSPSNRENYFGQVTLSAQHTCPAWSAALRMALIVRLETKGGLP